MNFSQLLTFSSSLCLLFRLKILELVRLPQKFDPTLMEISFVWFLLLKQFEITTFSLRFMAIIILERLVRFHICNLRSGSVFEGIQERRLPSGYKTSCRKNV
jgi:hypothetical protein